MFELIQSIDIRPIAKQSVDLSFGRSAFLA